VCTAASCAQGCASSLHEKELVMHGSLRQQSESSAPFESRLNPKAPVWSVFEVKNVGLRLGRKLLALGSVLLSSFDQVKVELFDEIENSLRITIVLSADSALDRFFTISLHPIPYYAVRVAKPNRENGRCKQTS
jgi:hypothetical protein